MSAYRLGLKGAAVAWAPGRFGNEKAIVLFRGVPAMMHSALYVITCSVTENFTIGQHNGWCEKLWRWFFRHSTSMRLIRNWSQIGKKMCRSADINLVGFACPRLVYMYSAWCTWDLSRNESVRGREIVKIKWVIFLKLRRKYQSPQSKTFASQFD